MRHLPNDISHEVIPFLPLFARMLAGSLGLQEFALCSFDAAFECSLHAHAAAFPDGDALIAYFPR